MLPENDRWSETRSQLLAQMDVSMGGRVAEEIIFGHEYITTGNEEFLMQQEEPGVVVCRSELHILRLWFVLL